MNDLATHLSGFLREHLPAERNASQHTCEAYAYSFQLLVEFAAGRLKCKPSQLTLDQIDASMIMTFLEHIEAKRGNCARTRTRVWPPSNRSSVTSNTGFLPISTSRGRFTLSR